MPKGKHFVLQELMDKLDKRQDTPFVQTRRDQHIVVGLYQPHQPDRQSPHSRDEYYFVASGTASITVADETFNVSSGDAVFVPAHTNHKFAETSADFCCWVLFYGPDAN